MITHTISWSELVRTFCYLVAFVFTLKIFISASWDLFVLKIKKINSIREYAAITTCICFGVFCYMNFIFIVTGISAMTIPSPAHTLGRQLITSILYVSTSVVSGVASFMIEKRRRQIRHMIAQFEDYDSK